MASEKQGSLTNLLLMPPGEEDDEGEKQAQMLVDQIGAEATGYCCAAEEKCGMNNTPFTARDFHRCNTCHGRVHGIFCCVRQYEDEEGTSIYYCLKCGRPEDDSKKKSPGSTYNLRKKKPEDDHPEKVPRSSTYNLRTKNKVDETKNKEDETTAVATLATLATTSETVAKTSETFAKSPEKSAKTSGKSATALQKQIESPKKTIKRPEKIADVKGSNTARIFEVTARQVKKLQVATTWEEEEDRQEKPTCQYALLSCDEMLPKPFTKERYKRKTGQEQLTLQACEGFDPKKWGPRIKAMGADMEKGKRSGKNWKIVNNVIEHHQRIFGSTMKFRPYGGDKKQADTYNDVLGPGYDRPDEDGEKKPRAKRPTSGKKTIQRKKTKK